MSAHETPPGHTEIILQLDLSGRPKEQTITKAERPEWIRQQKEWYEKLSILAKETIQKIGCKVLAEVWLTAEMAVAVPEENFDEHIENLMTTKGVVDYYIRYQVDPESAPLED